MTDLAPMMPPARLAAASTEDLRAELARGLQMTASHLAHLSAVWAELERRGEDLGELRKGIARYLPAIAAGVLAAEAVVAFAGRPQLLARVAELPAAEQRRLAAGGGVAVVLSDGTTAELPAAKLTGTQVQLVFGGGGGIRTPVEQKAAAVRVRRKLPEPHRYRVRVEGANVRIGKMILPTAEIVDALVRAGAIAPPAETANA